MSKKAGAFKSTQIVCQNIPTSWACHAAVKVIMGVKTTEIFVTNDLELFCFQWIIILWILSTWIKWLHGGWW